VQFSAITSGSTVKVKSYIWHYNGSETSSAADFTFDYGGPGGDLVILIVNYVNGTSLQRTGSAPTCP
jgi:hypothetical protein